MLLSQKILSFVFMDQVKEQLYNICTAYVDQRIQSAEEAIAAARESANDDTKSSAGDKYETGREMMQQEIDRHKKQLEESRKLKFVLTQMDSGKTTGIVQNGSLVVTSLGTFYISISKGQITVDNHNYFAVSAASPIGMKLMRQKQGAELEFNGKPFRIEHIY